MPFTAYPLHLKCCGGKVQEQTDGAVCRFEIGSNRCEVNWIESLDCLQFDHDVIFYKEIEPMFAYDRRTIADWNQQLTLKSKAERPEFDAQSLFIERLDETGSEFLVHANGRADDRPGPI